MIQPSEAQVAQAVSAREMLWTYRGVSEESVEKDFFAALNTTVAQEITLRIHASNGRIWVGRELHLRIGPYTIQARLTNIEPLLATVVNAATHTIAQYRERAKDEGQDLSNFLAEILRYPDPQQGTIFDSLVGLNTIKDDLFRKLTLLIGPNYLENWVQHAYTNKPPRLLTQILQDRYPLVILEGDVGSGKTALARSIGHSLATRLNTEIALFVINAQVRGGGHVGELTQNISRAFSEAERCYEREQIPILLLVDEADSLAQARGGQQTHHEDDAGVNTLIQRIDRLRGRPMAVLFATNLAQSLDAAIMRRAIAAYHFDRPSEQQRHEAFCRILSEVHILEEDIAQLVLQTSPRQIDGFGKTKHRYTYSDLAQRIIPSAVEEAIYNQQPLTIQHLLNACAAIAPTPELHSAVGLPDPSISRHSQSQPARDKREVRLSNARKYRLS